VGVGERAGRLAISTGEPNSPEMDEGGLLSNVAVPSKRDIILGLPPSISGESGSAGERSDRLVDFLSTFA